MVTLLRGRPRVSDPVPDIQVIPAANLRVLLQVHHSTRMLPRSGLVYITRRGLREMRGPVITPDDVISMAPLAIGDL